MTTGPTLEVTGLRVEYDGRTALRDVSLEVPGGAITAVVGPSGCGKTSFLYALNRMHDLNPRARVQGRVRLGALDVLDPRTDVLSLRRQVGLIFQRPNPFPTSVYRNVAMALEQHGVRGRDALRERVERALREAGLWNEVRDGLGRPALALSGGQQQRLCIARAIALAPAVLLLDEPCSALDPRATAHVEDLLRALRGRYTLVVVTHNLAQAQRVSDRVACFWTDSGVGCLLEEGATPTMFDRPAHPSVRDYLVGRVG